MNEEKMREILIDYKKGNLTEDETLAQWQKRGFEDLGFAKVDHGRERRCGFPEVVYCEGKGKEQAVAIIKNLYEKSEGNVLATRCNQEIATEIMAEIKEAKYHKIPRILSIERNNSANQGAIAVICAGTSDLPIAEEAAITAEIMGNGVKRYYDVGVAGIHRLLAYEEEIKEARVLIVLAGMDGALSSVVGGLFQKPIIAVPTSVGYGANFGGLSALLAMLNSCASGITVVNIDNGFGAGYAASLINKL